MGNSDNHSMRVSLKHTEAWLLLGTLTVKLQKLSQLSLNASYSERHAMNKDALNTHLGDSQGSDNIE